jgi:hypothetical protein
MLVGYERATGGIIARPAPKAGPALRSGIEPERPFAASGNRPGPTATSAQSRNLNEGHCSGPAGWPMSLRQRLSCRAQSYGTTDHRNVLQVGRHVLSGPVSGRSPVGTLVTSGKHSVDPQRRASWRKRIRRQRRLLLIHVEIRTVGDDDCPFRGRRLHLRCGLWTTRWWWELELAD